MDSRDSDGRETLEAVVFSGFFARETGLFVLVREADAALAEAFFSGDVPATGVFTTVVFGASDVEAGAFGAGAFAPEVFAVELPVAGVFPVVFPVGAFVDFRFVVPFPALSDRGCADGVPPSAFI